MSRPLFLFSHFSICCSSYASLLITPRGEIMLDIPLKPRRMCGGEQNQSRLIRFSGHPKLILPPIGFGIHARWGGKMALQTRFIAPYFEGGFFFSPGFYFICLSIPIWGNHERHFAILLFSAVRSFEQLSTFVRVLPGMRGRTKINKCLPFLARAHLSAM